MTHAGCLHFLLLVRRQLDWRALVSLIFPQGKRKAEPARGVNPVSSAGRIAVPGGVCVMQLVYVALNRNKKWSDIFLRAL